MKTKLDQESRVFQERPGDSEGATATGLWCFHRRTNVIPRPRMLMVLGLLRQEKYLEI